MPSGPDSSGDVLPTPRQPSSPESVARDTVPTGLLPHSTMPPEGSGADVPRASSAPPAPPEAPTPSIALAAASPPASEVRTPGSDPDHPTLHSAAHPGSGSAAQWDERRIVHLEHELDQLSARLRLVDKRIDDVVLRLRTALALVLLAALIAGAWLLARN